MTATPLVVYAGQSKTYPIQCRTDSVDPATGQNAPAAYNSDDVLSGVVYQSRQTTPIFAFTPTWFTDEDTQTGYQQGQVQWWPTAAQAAMLVPTVRYTLAIWRTLASGGDPDPIARIPLVVVPLAIP